MLKPLFKPISEVELHYRKARVRGFCLDDYNFYILKESDKSLYLDVYDIFGKKKMVKKLINYEGEKSLWCLPHFKKLIICQSDDDGTVVSVYDSNSFKLLKEYKLNCKARLYVSKSGLILLYGRQKINYLNYKRAVYLIDMTNDKIIDLSDYLVNHQLFNNKFTIGNFLENFMVDTDKYGFVSDDGKYVLVNAIDFEDRYTRILVIDLTTNSTYELFDAHMQFLQPSRVFIENVSDKHFLLSFRCPYRSYEYEAYTAGICVMSINDTLHTLFLDGLKYDDHSNAFRCASYIDNNFLFAYYYIFNYYADIFHVGKSIFTILNLSSGEIIQYKDIHKDTKISHLVKFIIPFKDRVLLIDSKSRYWLFDFINKDLKYVGQLSGSCADIVKLELTPDKKYCVMFYKSGSFTKYTYKIKTCSIEI